MATRLILEPIFEADFEECSYSFIRAFGAPGLKESRTHLKAEYCAVYDANLKGILRFHSARQADSLCANAVADGAVLLATDRDVAQSPGGGEKKKDGGRPTVKRNDQGTPRGRVISPTGQYLSALVRQSVFIAPRGRPNGPKPNWLR